MGDGSGDGGFSSAPRGGRALIGWRIAARTKGDLDDGRATVVPRRAIEMDLRVNELVG